MKVNDFIRRLLLFRWDSVFLLLWNQLGQVGLHRLHNLLLLATRSLHLLLPLIRAIVNAVSHIIAPILLELIVIVVV